MAAEGASSGLRRKYANKYIINMHQIDFYWFENMIEIPRFEIFEPGFCNGKRSVRRKIKKYQSKFCSYAISSGAC